MKVSIKRFLLNTTMLVTVLMLTNAHAGDIAAGKAKSAACAACHGANGKSSIPTNPHLAGQQEMYLVKSIKDYRDGKRKNPMMNSMAAKLSDGDIADLAAFFASQK